MAKKDISEEKVLPPTSDIAKDFGGPRCSIEDEERFVNRIRADLQDKILSVSIPRLGRIAIEVLTEHLVEVALYIKTKAHYDAPMSVTGIDFPEENIFEVIYHVMSYQAQAEHPSIIQIRTKVPRETPLLSSLVKIWAGVEWHERETHEMLGIVFEGHPNLGRLLLPESWDDIPPLRKDYILPPYRGAESSPDPQTQSNQSGEANAKQEES